MTAVARPIRAGHWSDRPTPTHPDPQDPRIETKADKALALTVWAASPVLLVALAALLVCLVM